MTYSQLKKIIQQTGLSPEALAKVFKVSNMTLRRWSKAPGQDNVPEGSEPALIEGIHILVTEGKLDPQSAEVKAVVAGSTSNSFGAALSNLGISATDVSSTPQADKMAMALYQIGANADHRSQVDKGEKKLDWFRKQGKDWKKHIGVLYDVVRAPKISTVDKMIAYGALFYLIAPFDLIPDTLPFAGVVDDYSFLTMAAAYYIAKVPKHK